MGLSRDLARSNPKENMLPKPHQEMEKSQETALPKHVLACGLALNLLRLYVSFDLIPKTVTVMRCQECAVSQGLQVNSVRFFSRQGL